MEVKVIYEELGEGGMLTPVWMIVDHHEFNWERILYLDISAPFQRMTYYDIDTEHAAAAVPDYAYIRHQVEESLIGISLPIVQSTSEHDLSSISRLVLRIGDIEDALQYSLRTQLKW